MQLTKQIGEYLACAEICRRGYIATSFTGNVPEFDILAADKYGNTVSAQVKTIKSGSWQLDAGKFLDIELENGKKQIIKGKKKVPNSHIIYIFIKLIKQGEDEFYIIKLLDLQDIIYKHHSSYLKKHSGIRPKNPKSKHIGIKESELINHKGNWNLFK